MPLRLIVGPPNSGRAGEVRRRLVERAAEEPVLVVPTSDDAAWFERELCADGPALGISIRTFGWLFGDVAGALALELGPALTPPQRLALLRAATSSVELHRLRRSAQRPGFAPALDALLEELQAALVDPTELAERAAALDDGGHEAELAELYAAYERLRARSGRTDRGAIAAAALGGLRSDPQRWGGRPVFLYGFDDLTVVQRELVAALTEAADVTVALNYADRTSLAARATLLAELTEELGGDVVAELQPDEGHTPHRSLRHLDRCLFEPAAGTVPVDGGVRLLECAGERGEAETIGAEVARLLAAGVDPGEIAIVVRSPSGAGGVLASVLASFRIPVALEAHAPVDRTAVGRALVSLCRAAMPEGRAEDLLAHLRSDPATDPGLADGVERRIRRGEVVSARDVFADWRRPPRHLARLRSAAGASERLRVLAATGRELAEGAHREQAPLAAPGAGGEPGMLHPLELRAAVAAAELLEELAALGGLPDCPQPDLADAIEALEGAGIATWRGPTDGRVRILSPYRLRAGRARYLFVAALGEGEFPAAPAADPLLGDDRRRALGVPALVRRDQSDEERYLFHSCASRPTERLYLSWRSCDDEGTALARSPFIDEVLDLLGDDPAGAEAEIKLAYGLERVVLPPAQAPTERELARSLASRGPGARAAEALDAISVEGPARARVLELVCSASERDLLPGPLRVPRVIEELRARRVLSANQLEGWLSCPYRWFVDHELDPVRLEPESDPLWLGSVVHAALERLYGERPGADAIPREGDVVHWRRRFAELLEEAAGGARLGPERVAMLARAREQVERFLTDEAASETELRPGADLLEVGFGMEDSRVEGLPLGDFVLRGKIDRIDLAPDGSGAVVRDYKTGANVTPQAKFAKKGSLQIQLYMLVAQELLELEPIAGLYQPLGAMRAADRKPRGVALAGDERLDGLPLVSKDLLDSDGVTEAMTEARKRAVELGAELQAGAIGRRPLEGECPKYCTFQPICRLERAIGPPGEGQNGEGAE
ncbi:MAG: PD-(D/E)XK nuclease family protein [Solirubrobacterales bacterium]